MIFPRREYSPDAEAGEAGGNEAMRRFEDEQKRA